MTAPHPHGDLTRCQELLGQLNDYIDGALAAELCRDLELHLDSCADCQTLLDTLAKTISLYHALAETPADIPTDVEERLLRRLNLPTHN